jgi:hypothetical protein
MLRLTSTILPLLFASVAACTPPPAPPAPAAPAASPGPAADADTCTWETPLVAGVPGSPGHLIPSARNPNGHTELAWRMRAMQDHLAAVRAAIVDGAPMPPKPTDHHRIRCSWPTTASDRNAAFDAFSVNYLQALDALHDPAATAPIRARYDVAVASCRACHENTCPGPLMAIDSLALPGGPAPAPAPSHP